MKLFNKTIDRQLFKQYSLGSDLSKQEVVAKIFNPVGNGKWFILNSDPQDPDYLWAIVDLGYGAEVGSVSRSELENYRGRFGLGFERDLGFDPINAEELYNGLSEGKYYAKGGNMQGKDTWQNIFEEFGFKKGRSKYGLDMYYKRGYIASVDHELRNVDLMFEDDVLYRGFSVQGLLNALENQFGKRNFADGGDLKNVKLDFELETDGDYDYMYEDEVEKIKLLREVVDFDEVVGNIDTGKTIGNTNLKFYENDIVVMTIKGDYDTDTERLDADVDVLGNKYKINYHPMNSMGGFDSSKLKKELEKIDYKKSMGKRGWLSYVKDNSSYFDIEDESEEFVLLTTRENGNVGDEEYGIEDIEEAKSIVKKIKEKYPKTKVSIYTVDEFVYLELEAPKNFADGGGVNVGYNVFNYTDNIYATDEVFKTKALANKFIKEFRSRFSNQGYYRDNRMNKINIQDIDLLAIPSDFNPFKKFADGGQIEVVYERRADFKKKPIKLLILSRGKEQKGYTFSGKDQVAVLDNYNRNKQEDLEKLWNLKGYETKYADGGSLGNYDVVIDGDWDEPKKFRTFSLAKKWIYQNAKNYESLELVDPYGDTIFVEGNSTKEDLDWLFSNDEISAFAKGGNIADFTDNQQMIMNQNVELEHHHEELEDILKDEMPVPAWVVAKMATATQSISDVTHYLDGEKELMEDQLEEEDDDDDEDEMEVEEIENKEVVEPIVVTAGDKTQITKNFTNDAFGNLKGFLKGMEGIDLRDDYTFDYKDEQYEVEPIINSDENGVSNAVFTIFDGDGEEVGEVAYSREGGKQKFTANSEFFSWNNAKFEDGGFMNGVYADGGRIEDLETVIKKFKRLIERDYKYYDVIEYKAPEERRLTDGRYLKIVAVSDEYGDFDSGLGRVIKKYLKVEPSFVDKGYGFRTYWVYLKHIKDAMFEDGGFRNDAFADGGYFDGTIPKVSTYMSTYAKGGEVAKAEILGLKRNIMGTTSIEMKISGMRKPQVFSVYPISKDDTDKTITIQSSTRIGKIDLGSGRGLMSQSHSNGAYFVHFQMDKLTPFTISESDLEDLKMHIFKTAGDNVGSRGIVSDNSGASGVYAYGGGLYKLLEYALLEENGNEEYIDNLPKYPEVLTVAFNKNGGHKIYKVYETTLNNGKFVKYPTYRIGRDMKPYSKLKYVLKALDKKVYDENFDNDNYAKGGTTDRVPVSAKLSKAEISNFVSYVHSVYEEQGFTERQVKIAVNKYLTDLGKQYTYGWGDSLDRERVYQYLLDPKLSEIKNPRFADGGFMNNVYAKGGMVVTSVKDIPNFKERLEQRRITYRGLGMGKVADDFYKLAGTSGTRIKVDGKEYFITDEEFDTFSRGADGKMQIRFDAPARKGYADGGFMNGVYEDGGFLDKYEVDRFKQVMNGKAIAKYIVRLQDSFGNKETYVFGIKIKDQFKGCELVPYESLYGGWSNSGTAFSLDNLQVEKLVPNKFFNIELDEQETEMLVNKLLKNNQSGVEKYLNSAFFYLSYNQSFKDILRGHLARSVVKIVSVEFEISQKFADGGFMSDVYAKGGNLPSQSYYGMGTPYKRLTEEEKEDLRFNNYNFKSAKQVWGAWTVEQQQHFLKDHIENNVKHQNYIKKEGENLMFKAFRKYEDLPTVIKSELIEHIKKGQYAKGGSVKEEMYVLVKPSVTSSDDFNFSYAEKQPNGYVYFPFSGYEKSKPALFTRDEAEKVLDYKNRTERGIPAIMLPFGKKVELSDFKNLKVSNNDYEYSPFSTNETKYDSSTLSDYFADGGFMNDVYADGGQVRVGDRYKYNWSDGRGNNGYSVVEIVKQSVTSSKDYKTKVMVVKVVESSDPSQVGRLEEEYKPSFKKAVRLGMYKPLQERKRKLVDEDYANGGSVKKDWWQTVVNPNEDFHNYDNRKPIDWEVDDFKEWVVSNSDLDGNVDKEVLEVVKMPKSKLTVEYLNKNGSGKNNNEYYKEFGNWQSALYDIFTQLKKDYLFKKERKYILKSDIKTVTVKRKGKEVTYNGSDVLNGAYVLAKGGDITSKANYVGKNDVVEVELKDGSKVKPANGYWIKKGAEPISNEPTPTTSAKSGSKVGETYIRKDMRNNWKAETNVDDFNGYDWRISTIKTYSGNLVSSAQGGKTESTGTKGIKMFVYAMYQDPNYTLEVSTPKRLTEKLVTEQHEKALAKFKKFMETGMFKGGGKISNFDKLSAKVAKQYEGKPVKSQYQEEYGKYYSKEEAQEVGDKVAGKVKAMQPAKKEMGGGTKKATSGSEILKQANILAKEIRKDGESWNDAKKRAFAQLKK